MKNLIRTLNEATDIPHFQGKTYLFLAHKSIPRPRVGTNACRDYFVSLDRCNELFSFIVNMASHIDYMGEMAEKALTTKDGGRIILAEDVDKPLPPPRIKLLNLLKEKHLQFLLEILLVRLVEN